MKKQRKFFTASNKYQEKIVLVAAFPALLVFLSLVFSLMLVRENVILAVKSHRHINFDSALMIWLYHSYIYIIFGLCCIFIISLIVTFVYLKNLIGPFNRINRELDEIIEGRSNRLLTARPEDEMVNGLLKRVNVLVQSYVERKK
ncbi:MAG: hypothetical protein HQL12_04400 [Candidatus Omnitrophica bacterium]|nr:hypothetical protein [Candidatus Omnitrophota bacterium]